MQMRPSRVLRKLRAGEIVTCFKLNTFDLTVAEIAARAGFDCLWLDAEHCAGDWSAIHGQILAAKVYDTDVLVRVSRGPYSDYIKPLELDAAGIIVPHVMSAADCKQVARMTRFHPIGRRPIDGGNADGAFCTLPVQDYIRQANEQRFVIVQIEDPEPMDELEAICAVEGIDMIFFGPNDFSQGIGHPGELDHPQVIDARKRIAACAVAHGKFAGTVGTPDCLEELSEMGYRFFGTGADVVGLSQYCRDLAAQLAERTRNLAV